MIRIGKTLRNVLMAILNGDYVLRLGIDRLFGHVLYFFLVVFMYLVLLFSMDLTMKRLEESRAELMDMEILHAARSCDLAKQKSLEFTRQNLERSKSKVGLPQKPAKKL